MNVRSQPETILRHLRRYGWVTSYFAWRRWNITRLADVVHKLRARGVGIQTMLIERRGSRYAHYRLAK